MVAGHVGAKTCEFGMTGGGVILWCSIPVERVSASNFLPDFKDHCDTAMYARIVYA
jgi:hypothetical protein